MTIASAINTSCQKLSHVSDAPSLDADRLLLHVLNQKESSWLYAHGDKNLTQPQQILLAKLIKERQTGRPLAYLLGEWEFYGRPFYVTPDVLIPRPSTEGLIDTTLQYLSSLYPPSKGDEGGFAATGGQSSNSYPLTIADIGTGSGCIIISLLCELNKYKIKKIKFKFIATDISKKALAVARRNAKRHGVADQIEFLQCDMLLDPPDKGDKDLPAVALAKAGGFAAKKRDIDLIVSNPPYIPTAELAKKGSGAIISVETKGLRFEPRVALDGGPDGLDYIRRLSSLPYPMILESINGQVIKKNL